jgi:hypothetical protein
MRKNAEKAAAFRALHDEPGTFIIPNPWDAGTARLLAGLGFKALATTSLGLANIHGRGFVSADEIIGNARVIAAATTAIKPPPLDQLTSAVLGGCLPVDRAHRHLQFVGDRSGGHRCLGRA